MTATTEPTSPAGDRPEAGSDAPTPGPRPWWARPRTWVIIGIVVVIAVVLWRFGGGGVRFSTDKRPAPGTRFDWGYFWSLVPDMLRALWVSAAGRRSRSSAGRWRRSSSSSAARRC